MLALAIIAVALAIVKGVARFRGSHASFRAIGLTIVLAPTIAFFGMQPYYAGAGLGFGVAVWIIYALLRVALTPPPMAINASSRVP
jgi:hypothetical protein